MEAKRYRVDTYEEDFIKVWNRFDYIVDYLADFVKHKRDVVDYSLAQPLFIKKAIENSEDNVKKLLLRMFLKNNTNYHYLIEDSRVRKSTKKLILQLEEEDDTIRPIFKLYEYVKWKKKWEIIEEFEETPVDEQYIQKVPLVLNYLFGYEW